MRQSEFKEKYNPMTGKFAKQHIWDGRVEIITGEGITDKFKSLVRRKKNTKNGSTTKTDLKHLPLQKKLVIK